MKKIGILIVVCGCFLIGSIAYAGSVSAPYGDSGIFGGTVNMKPNVLIIFDTSGSMNDTVNVSYSSTTTYIGSYTSNAVYYGSGSSYTLLTSSVSNLNSTTCATAITNLNNNGYWTGKMDITSLSCGSSTNRTFYMGNYLNWMNDFDTTTSSNHSTKLAVARTAIEQVLQSQIDTDGNETMRMGLMRFDHSDQYCGGYMVLPCGTDYLKSGSVVGSTFYNALESISSGNGNTPLAESLAEAGLYFAGQDSWAWNGRALPTDDSYMKTTTASSSSSTVANYTSYTSTGTKTYKSPILWRCQKNYIIVFTDGNSTSDYGDGPCTSYSCFMMWCWCSGTTGPNIFTGRSYINSHYLNSCLSNTSRHDYDCDNAEASDGQHWLDDVAKFLYTEDLRNSTDKDASGSSTFNDSTYATQNVITYTVGFGTATDTALLTSTSENGGSGGAGEGYFNALSQTELQEALSSIMNKIKSNNATFVAPVVPASKLTGSYSGNAIYLGLFKPESDNIWRGNVKKYGFRSTDSMFMQKNGSSNALDSNYNIATSATSVWTQNGADGQDVDAGGVGEWVRADSKNNTTPTRTFYTNNSTHTALTSFSTANTELTITNMSLSSSSTVSDYIDWIKGSGSYKPDTATTGRDWVMGDILHSRPVIQRAGTGYKNYIFVGANDGFLYCIEDSEYSDNANLTDLANDSVLVKWCYTPWELVSKLHEIRDDINREYFVDGSPTLYTYTTNSSGSETYVNKSITFGLRRGGNSYYTLNVGTINSNNAYTYAAPSWRWWINGSTFAPGGATLGQSWAKPYLAKYKNSATSTDWTQALVLSGGYDDTTEDALNPESPPTTLPTADTKGRCVYAVSTADGSLLKTIIPHTTAKYSIVDFLAFDRNNNGYLDTVYAGDMGGNLYAARDWTSMTATETGYWTSTAPFMLFSNGSTSTRASTSGSVSSMVLKIFNAPEAGLETWGDYVLFGTGDREHPNAYTVSSGHTQTVDRFYSIKNYWSGTTLTESNLVDVTEANYSTYDFNNSSYYGWYIRLNERTGEKVTSAPVLFNKIVYFTTYTPPDSATASATDLCQVTDLGTARLYAVDYKTGAAAYTWGSNAKTNRNKVIGSGISTQPSVVVTGSGAKLIVATTQGIFSLSLPSSNSASLYYWLQK